MHPYHKIQTIFKRDPETKYKTLLLDQYSKPEFELLKDCEWVWTEKIDGTNIRVMWDGNKVAFGGRTNKAETPKFLLEKLTELFPPEKMKAVFGTQGGITLYGEGYGNRIQKVGSQYLKDSVSFILFDINANGIWFTREANEQFHKELHIPIVPIVGVGTLHEAVDFTEKGFVSQIGNCVAEGLILRPKIELRDRLGNRIITKIKFKDFNNT